MAKVLLLIMTDGRTDYLNVAKDSYHRLSRYSSVAINDDSGSPEYRAWLERAFPGAFINSSEGRSGFGGAIINAWDYASQFDAEYIFHMEDDFIITRDIDIDAMIRVLEDNPHIAQLALRRQPWNDIERAAGGIVESRPTEYVEWHDDFGNAWLQQRLFFTTNPSLYRMSLTQRGWPLGEHSEGVFGIELFKDPSIYTAYWGTRNSGEWCEHIGHERAGHTY